ncbi:MAG: DUF169 domain-containing protein [bacterium]
MEKKLKENFLKRWKRYFHGAELPIAFYYSNEETGVELVSASTTNRCLIANLIKVRKGTPLRFDADSIGCAGGRRYVGFSYTLRKNFEYFLSCGISGELEGERYKKSPELVKAMMARWPKFEAPQKYIVFKRWDEMAETDDPEVVIFFAKPDVLAGLYTLAGFDELEDRVIAPFGAGCASIVQYPYLEKDSDKPHCVIGMFDPSARPYVPEDALTFAVPMKKFARMVENMDESFLITTTWGKIKKRI